MLARRLIDQIDAAGLDAVISNAAGCGSHLKHYAGLLADDPAYAARAAHWASKVRDVSEWLVQIGFRPPTAAPFGAAGEIVTYHDACHLCHGQGILEQPRALLRSIPGLELRESAESTWCCGSAGIYAITQPATAGALRNRKWQHLDATGASIVAMGNPGCSLHLQRRSGETARAEILHPVELLARAYAAEGQKKGAPQ
jgi:glycolate oxidase iron-sulfur subunit